MYLTCGLALFLAVSILIPAFAEIPSPLKQLQDGVPPEHIQCSEGRILLESPAGTIACVWENTAVVLEVRGFAAIISDEPTGMIDAPDSTQDNSALPKADAQTRANFTIPQDITVANNDFALDFYRQISDNDDNLFFSPSSMYVAFSVLYEGAKGDTAQQIQDVFGLEPNADARHNSTAHAMASLNRDDPHATLNMANALWLADWFSPFDSYLDVARGTYLAGVEAVNFTDDDDGVKKINMWASDNTNEKIKAVITPDDVDESTAMVITNAIYFKGTWMTQFPAEDTQESDFWTNSTKSADTDFMHVTGVFNYTEYDDVQVLKLPYVGDRLSMLVALPSDLDGIATLEESISSETIAQWNQDMYGTEVIVTLPKFTMKTHYDLNKFLIDLGMPLVFNGHRADLSGIAILPDANLYVSKAVQDAFVDVNEEGTEAAAVTSIWVNAWTSQQPGPPSFVADHPFIFIIQDDESGAILFMGRLSDPTA